MADVVVSVRDLHKRYGDLLAVNGLLLTHALHHRRLDGVFHRKDYSIGLVRSSRPALHACLLA
jgi:hypothetical protein